VGARPGGAGKTTVMCALLNLVPKDVALAPATAEAVRQAGRRTPPARHCFICHEIGSGPYFAYLWGRDLRAYCALSEMGQMLATNLHADDLEEAREQVCEENRVSESHFNRFELMLFLRVGRGFSPPFRRVDKVYESSGDRPHGLVFDAGSGLNRLPSGDRWHERCRDFLQTRRAGPARTIEDTRRAVLALLDGHP
jgi:hypothetical protein